MPEGGLLGIARGVIELDASPAIRSLNEFGAKVQEAGSEAQGRLANIGSGLTSLGQKLSLGVTLPLVGAFAEATHLAEGHNALVRQTTELYGQNAAALEKFADGAGKAWGLTTDEALKAETGIAAVGKSLGFTNDQLPGLSEQLIGAAGNLGKFKDADPSDVLQAMTLGLQGNARGLKRYGIDVTEAQLNTEAFKETGIRNFKQLTDQQQAQVRLNVITKDAAAIYGNTASASGDLGFKTRQLRAELEDFGVKVGEVVLPYAVKFAGLLVDLADRASRLSPTVIEVGVAVAAIAAVVGPALIVIGGLASGLGALFAAVNAGGTVLGLLLGPIGLIVVALTALALAYATNFLGFRDLVNGLASDVLPVLERVAAAVGEFLTVAKRFYDLQGIAGVFDYIGIRLYNAFGPRVFGVFNALRTAFGDLVAVVESLAAVVADVFQGKWEDALHDAGRALQGFLAFPEDIAVAFGSLASLLDRAIADLLFSVRTGFAPIDDIIAGIASVFQDAGKLLDDLVHGRIAAALSDLGALVLDAAKTVGAAALLIPRALLAAFDAIDWGAVGAALAKGLSGALSLLGAAGSALLGLAASLGAAMLAAVRRIDWADVGRTVLDAIGNAVAAGGSLLLSIGLTIAGDILDFARDAWGWLVAHVKGLATVDNLERAVGFVLHLTGQVVNEVEGWVSDLWSWVKGVLPGWPTGDQLRQGLDLAVSLAGDVTNAIEGWVSDVWSWVKGVLPGWPDRDQLRQGLSLAVSLAGSITNGIVGLAKGVWGWVKSVIPDWPDRDTLEQGLILSLRVGGALVFAVKELAQGVWHWVKSFIPDWPDRDTLQQGLLLSLRLGGDLVFAVSGLAHGLWAWVKSNIPDWPARDTLEQGLVLALRLGGDLVFGITELGKGLWHWVRSKIPDWPDRDTLEQGLLLSLKVGGALTFAVRELAAGLWSWIRSKIPDWPVRDTLEQGLLFSLRVGGALVFAVTELASGLWNWIRSKIPDWPAKDTLEQGLIFALRVGGDLTFGVKELAGGVWAWIESKIPDWPAKGALTRGLSLAIDLAVSLGKTVKGLAGGLWGLIAPAIGWPKADTITSALSEVIGLSVSLGKTIGGLANGLWGLISTAIGWPVGNVLHSALTQVIDLTVGLGKTIKGIQNAEGVLETVNQVLGIVRNPLDPNGWVVHEAVSVALDITGQSTDKGQKPSALPAGTLTQDPAVITAAITAAKSANDQIAGYVTGIVGQLDRLVSALQTKGADAGQAFESALGGKFKDTNDTILGFAGDKGLWAASLQPFVAAADSKAKGAGQAILDALGAKLPLVNVQLTASVLVWGGILQGFVQAASSKALGAGQAIMDAMAAKLPLVNVQLTASAALWEGILGGDLASAFYADGVNAGAAFVNGLNSQLGAVAAVATSMASTAIGTLNAGLGIFSPSRVFRQSGNLSGAGYALGLQDSLPRVTDAVRQLVTAITGASAAGNAANVQALLAAQAVGQAAPTIVDNRQYFALRGDELSKLMTDAEWGSAFATDMVSGRGRAVALGR